MLHTPPVLTQVCENRDFTEWHQGCAWCAVWVLLLRGPALAQRVQRARLALGDWLWPGYARQPHVTIAYRGLMACGDAHPAATFGVEQLRADVQRLQQALHGPATLRVYGSSSFSTVPYLCVAQEDAALLQQWHQALAVDGFVMFSCLGPDTVKEMRALYQQLGWPAAGHNLTDMHDWGDMLVHAGFAEPVMDMETITLTFASPERLLQELRELGCNLHPQRFAGLRGRAWLAQLHAALGQHLRVEHSEGQLALTFELVYGHAFKPAPRVALEGESTVSLDQMRSMLKQGREQGLR